MYVRNPEGTAPCGVQHLTAGRQESTDDGIHYSDELYESVADAVTRGAALLAGISSDDTVISI